MPTMETDRIRQAIAGREVLFNSLFRVKIGLYRAIAGIRRDSIMFAKYERKLADVRAKMYDVLRDVGAARPRSGTLTGTNEKLHALTDDLQRLTRKMIDAASHEVGQLLQATKLENTYLDRIIKEMSETARISENLINQGLRSDHFMADLKRLRANFNTWEDDLFELLNLLTNLEGREKRQVISQLKYLGARMRSTRIRIHLLYLPGFQSVLERAETRHTRGKISTVERVLMDIEAKQTPKGDERAVLKDVERLEGLFNGQRRSFEHFESNMLTVVKEFEKVDAKVEKILGEIEVKLRAKQFTQYAGDVAKLKDDYSVFVQRRLVGYMEMFRKSAEEFRNPVSQVVSSLDNIIRYSGDWKSQADLRSRKLISDYSGRQQ